MRILIGYDGSECSEAVLADLSRAGMPDGSEILIFTVSDESQLKKDDASALASTAADRLRPALPACTVTSLSVAGTPADALLKHAESWGADLIAVGSHGRSMIGRVLMGSVSQKILSNAACSVRISRKVPADRAGPPKLVLGIDGSPSAAAALNAVSLRQWPAGTEVRVVVALDAPLMTAIPALMPDFSWPTPADPELRRWTSAAAESAVEELRQSGVNAVPVVRDGDPRTVLLEEAKATSADCIFLGARGHGRIEGLLLGSVSASVASKAHCSVEVVRFE